MNEAITQLQEQLDRIERQTAIAAKTVLTLDEVVMITGFSKHHIYTLTMQKEIPFSKRGGRLFFDKTKVEAWLLGNETKSNEDIELEAKRYITKANAERRKTAQ